MIILCVVRDFGDQLVYAQAVHPECTVEARVVCHLTIREEEALVALTGSIDLNLNETSRTGNSLDATEGTIFRMRHMCDTIVEYSELIGGRAPDCRYGAHHLTIVCLLTRLRCEDDLDVSPLVCDDSRRELMFNARFDFGDSTLRVRVDRAPPTTNETTKGDDHTHTGLEHTANAAGTDRVIHWLE